MKISENLKVCLQNVKKINEKLGNYHRKAGLCFLTNKYVSDENLIEVKIYLENNKPSFTWYTFFNQSNYWWKPGKVAPRRRWLKKHIKKLEKQNR